MEGKPGFITGMSQPPQPERQDPRISSSLRQDEEFKLDNKIETGARGSCNWRSQDG